MLPHWVIFSGASSGAIHLYAILMKYADNHTGQAFPARSRLASDLGKSVDTVDRHVKELKDIGALKVMQRKRRDSQENYTNLYTLITTNPQSMGIPDGMDVEVEEVAATLRPPSRTHAAENHTHLTTPTPSFTSDKSDPGYTPEQSSGHANPGNIPGPERARLRRQLQAVGKSIQDGKPFYHEHTQELWWDFIGNMEDSLPELHDQLSDLLENGKWTVSAKVAGAYEAGTELNKLIWTAMDG